MRGSVAVFVLIVVLALAGITAMALVFRGASYQPGEQGDFSTSVPGQGEVTSTTAG